MRTQNTEDDAYARMVHPSAKHDATNNKPNITHAHAHKTTQHTAPSCHSHASGPSWFPSTIGINFRIFSARIFCVCDQLSHVMAVLCSLGTRVRTTIHL